MAEEHNHVTRDIKPPGACPGCDVYHRSQDPRNGGESADVERTRLARMLEASGHAGCAYDLEAADAVDAAEVAYAVAEHVEEACGDGDFTANPDLAGKLREWADRLERVDPEVARKGKIPISVHRVKKQVYVDVRSGDLLDLAREGDDRVTLTVNGEALMDFMRIGPAPGGNGTHSG